MKTSTYLFATLLVMSTHAAETQPVLSAQDLAARLSTMEAGNFQVRAKMEITPAGGAAKSTFQLQIKIRRTQAATDAVYQILWPKERNGESVLLKQPTDGTASGAVFTLPDTLTQLSAGQMKQALFGSDLSYEDVTINPFAWNQQAIIGEGIVDRVTCQILESKPGKGTRSSYSAVRTWVDPRRLVALRIEKYATSGAIIRRIETTRVTTDDDGRHVPSSIRVTRPGQGSSTELEGSRIRRDIKYADSAFMPSGIRNSTSPK